MNVLLILLLIWIFSFTEDMWFNRLLRYQLSGEAEKLGVRTPRAATSFDKRTRNYSWVALGLGLSLIVISFPKQFTVSWSGLSFLTGVLLCVSYIVVKMKAYWQASKGFTA